MWCPVKDWKVKTIKSKSPNHGKKYVMIDKGGFVIRVFRHRGDIFLFQFIDECGEFIEECHAEDVNNIINGFGERVEVHFPDITRFIGHLGDVDVTTAF